MSTRKSISNRFALLRHWREGRELSRSLRESLLMDDEGWVVRDSAGSGNTTVEYVLKGDKELVRFSLKLCSCALSRCCQTVQASVVSDGQTSGAVVWLPPIARLLLRNAVRLFVLRYANKIADKSLGN